MASSSTRIGTALERLPAGEADEVGALHEEAEGGADDPLHLGPALGRLGRHGLVHQGEPVVERVEQHRPVERDLRREVVEEARRPDADLVGDVGETGAGEAPVGEALAGHHEDRVPGAGRRRRHPPSLRLGGRAGRGVDTDAICTLGSRVPTWLALGACEC